jgi:hypothetical protein
MALPANLRVNLSAPFPALVQGSGPVTVTKTNGVWTVGFTMAAIGSIVPPAGNYPTDFLFGFDSISGQFFKISLTNLATTFGLVSGATRAQRAVTASPITISPTDQILNCNIAAGAPTCALPQASTRVGVPLTFKDLGQAAAHNITITPFAGDTIDGAGSFVLNLNRQGVTLVPFNDGTNTGWTIQ